MSNTPSTRLAVLRSQLTTHQALLLSNPSDVTYYSNFSYLVPEEREGLLLVTSQQAYLFHASFSPTPVTKDVVMKSGVAPHQLVTHIRSILAETPFTELLVDKTRLFAEEYEALQQIKELTFESLDRSIIWRQRMVKDDQEIQAITKASLIAQQAIATIREQLHAGLSEREVQQLLETEMTRLGSQKPAFPTIVAFGPHAALPHHQPTSMVLEPETAVLIDFGATIDGYRSDMTVSFWFGDQAPEEYLKMSQAVHDAYQAVIGVLSETGKSEVTAASLDETARTVITTAGFGPLFIHTTGHGVGLDIHEQPSIHWHNDLVLEPNMVITIEPGIYVSNKYGYRYEHTVLLTKSGYQELTNASRDFDSPTD